MHQHIFGKDFHKRVFAVYMHQSLREYGMLLSKKAILQSLV
jgi:hypothetical protein